MAIVAISCCKDDPIMIDPVVGDTYQGGIVAKILDPSDPGYVSGETHGIIVADVDQSTAAEWGGYFELITVPGTSTLLGTGQDNTTLIVNAVGTQSYQYAAQLCDDLTLGGYDDWYLPSDYELVVIRPYLPVDDRYWSSSEKSNQDGFTQPPTSGEDSRKDKLYKVRAIRSF